MASLESPVASRVDEVASILADARRTGVAVRHIPESLRTAELLEGFAIQQRVGDLLSERVGGWKCALPSDGKLIAAPIYADTIQTGTDFRVNPGASEVRVEPELACRLAQDLPPQANAYSRRDVLDAIGSVHLALEVLRSRFAYPQFMTFAELLADGLFNEGLVLGPRIWSKGEESACPMPGSFPITLSGADEKDQYFDGRHPDGNPLAPIVWLANFLSCQGVGLLSGQLIITGSYAGVFDLPPNSPLAVRFGELGGLSTRFVSHKE